MDEHCGRAYALSDEAGRRDYNQAWFEAIYLDADAKTASPASPAYGARRCWPACRRTALRSWRRRSLKNNNAAKARARAAPTLSVFGTLHMWWS